MEYMQQTSTRFDSKTTNCNHDDGRTENQLQVRREKTYRTTGEQSATLGSSDGRYVIFNYRSKQSGSLNGTKSLLGTTLYFVKFRLTKSAFGTTINEFITFYAIADNDPLFTRYPYIDAIKRLISKRFKKATEPKPGEQRC